MAVSVTSDMTLISNCNATTGWNGGTVNANFQLEGTNCLGEKVSAALQAVKTFTFGTAQDMTGKFVVMTMLITGLADTIAQGGYRIYIEDSAGNNGTWYVGGNDTHSGGWGYFTVDPSTTPTAGTGTINVASIAKVGVQMKTLSTSLGNNSNAFWDICYFGSYIMATSLTGDNVSLTDLVATSDTNFWGFLRSVDGVIFGQGKIILGDTATNHINFTADGSALVFKENAFLPDTLNGILVQGAAGTTTNVTFKNGLIKGVGTQNPYISANGGNLNIGNLEGQTLQNFAASDISSLTNISASFDACGQIIVGSTVCENSTFRNSTDVNGALLWPGGTNTKNCSFLNNTRAIKITAAGEYNFDGMLFSGNTYDVENASTGTVTINNLNQSNASTAINTAGGTTTFVTAVPVTIKCVDENNNNIEGIVVYVENSSTKAQILSASTNASGIATISFNYPGSDVSINIRLRKASSGATKYVPIKTTGTITNTGFSLTATLYVDPIAAP